MALEGLGRTNEAQLCRRLALELAALKKNPTNESLKQQVRAIRQDLAAARAAPQPHVTHDIQEPPPPPPPQLPPPPTQLHRDPQPSPATHTHLEEEPVRTQQSGGGGGTDANSSLNHSTISYEEGAFFFFFGGVCCVCVFFVCVVCSIMERFSYCVSFALSISFEFVS